MKIPFDETRCFYLTNPETGDNEVFQKGSIEDVLERIESIEKDIDYELNDENTFIVYLNDGKITPFLVKEDIENLLYSLIEEGMILGDSDGYPYENQVADVSEIVSKHLNENYVIIDGESNNITVLSELRKYAKKKSEET